MRQVNPPETGLIITLPETFQNRAELKPVQGRIPITVLAAKEKMALSIALTFVSTYMGAFPPFDTYGLRANFNLDIKDASNRTLVKITLFDPCVCVFHSFPPTVIFMGARKDFLQLIGSISPRIHSVVLQMDEAPTSRAMQ
jgi:hypothetical protein